MFAFPEAFEQLTNYKPFPWQQRLFDKFIAGEFPTSCNLPTGLGKTSVIAVWLLARAAAPASARVPRRLVYVVNRRTVVDQATVEAEKLQNNCAKVPELQTFGALAISTLRGQLADNRKWSADPAQPAVIVGTVDMIGSRLLFSGYGVGFKLRPLHAGFLGQDAMLVHDEAHLEPAFHDLLLAIEKEQDSGERTGALPWPKLRVLELSATPRSAGPVFELDDEDQRHPIIRERIDARKQIHLVENKDAKKLAEEIADLALQFDDRKQTVLVFVRRVEDVEKICKQLPKGRYEQLTGTLRGKERDTLVTKANFQRFLPGAVAGAETVYLVCTSAGEVGINISADQLVCDLTTFDSMAQRFGRVNRFGSCADTAIHVVQPRSFDESDDYERRLQATLRLLQQLAGDGSPAALGRLDLKARQAAFAAEPQKLPTSDILLDAWALTSIREKLPGRPPVEPYLHGLTEELPETHVAWREEVGRITGEWLEVYPPVALLEDYPLKPHELLRDNASRVFDRLKKLKATPTTPIWVMENDGTVSSTVKNLGDLIEAGKENLGGKTVLLPPAVGGLANGMLVSEASGADDVADDWYDAEGRRRRARLWDAPAPKGMRLVRAIDLGSDDEDAETPAQRCWYWYEREADGDGEGSKANHKPVLLEVHTADVVRHATELVTRLGLPGTCNGPSSWPPGVTIWANAGRFFRPCSATRTRAGSWPSPASAAAGCPSATGTSLALCSMRWMRPSSRRSRTAPTCKI